ncbi:MAG: hypothetical protein ACK5PD_14625 [Pirellulaceae bacterium]
MKMPIHTKTMAAQEHWLEVVRCVARLAMEVGVSDIDGLGSWWATRKSGPNFSSLAQIARGPKVPWGEAGVDFEVGVQPNRERPDRLPL